MITYNVALALGIYDLTIPVEPFWAAGAPDPN
jgi:hypothetical protein